MKEEIDFADFLNIALNEQLRIHKKFLKVVKSAFVEQDPQNLGYMNQEALVAFLEQLDDDNHFDKEDIVEKTDPDGTDVITFTQLVTTLSDYHVSRGDDKVTLLQYFYDKFN